MATVVTLINTNNRRYLASSLLISSIISLSNPDALASEIFDTKCAGCHTIGGGAMVGPDLAPSSKWSDTDLQKSIKDMEKNVGPLTDEEVDALVVFIRAPLSNKSTPAPNSNAQSTEAMQQLSAANPQLKANQKADTETITGTPEAGEPSSGARLFNGQQSFKNGGLSCIACHQAEGRGGTMGPDLTGIAAKMPAKALINACQNTPYKVMKTTYKEHSITHQEAVDLSAYLDKIKDSKAPAREVPVPLYASATAGLLLGLMAIGYRNRNKSVHIKLKRRN